MKSSYMIALGGCATLVIAFTALMISGPSQYELTQTCARESVAGLTGKLYIEGRAKQSQNCLDVTSVYEMKMVIASNQSILSMGGEVRPLAELRESASRLALAKKEAEAQEAIKAAAVQQARQEATAQAQAETASTPAPEPAQAKAMDSVPTDAAEPAPQDASVAQSAVAPAEAATAPVAAQPADTSADAVETAAPAPAGIPTATAFSGEEPKSNPFDQVFNDRWQ